MLRSLGKTRRKIGQCYPPVVDAILVGINFHKASLLYAEAHNAAKPKGTHCFSLSPVLPATAYVHCKQTDAARR